MFSKFFALSTTLDLRTHNQYQERCCCQKLPLWLSRYPSWKYRRKLPKKRIKPLRFCTYPSLLHWKKTMNYDFIQQNSIIILLYCKSAIRPRKSPLIESEVFEDAAHQHYVLLDVHNCIPISICYIKNRSCSCFWRSNCHNWCARVSYHLQKEV